jgi:hypothetical protein
LTGDEIDLLNGYLADYKDPAKSDLICFTATITMDNVTAPGGSPYTLPGEVELLVELEIAP